MSMHDCSTDISNLHRDRVNLPQATQDKLRANRDANHDRLERGLKKNGDPAPQKYVKQGSYAMKTMVQDQHGNNDYDIDDGVVFNTEDLVGRNGGAKSPLDARWMVRDAVDDGSFKTDPEVKKNCVRVHYNEGHHVDMPVYRQEKEKDGTEYELASATWRTSNPEGVTQWFEGQLKAKQPDAKDTGNYQMRRLVRYLKYWSKSRPSWNMPSGFIWTVLVDEAFVSADEREDRALYNAMVAIRNRLRIHKMVAHPVVSGEWLTSTTADPCMVECEKHLTEAINDLQVLHRDDCKRHEALTAWKKVFNTDYFDGEIEKDKEREKQKAKTHARSFIAAPSPWADDSPVV